MTNTFNNIRNMRFSNGAKLGALCVASAIIAACSTTEAPGPLEPTGATGRVRLVNVINDALRARVNASLEGLVFTVDLQYAQAAPANLPAPATAPYAAIYSGSRSFVLKRTADTTVTVATLPFTVNDGQDQTVYAIGGVGGSAVTSAVTTDDNTAPAATETRVRVVNMSPTAGAVDVFITAIGADLATATPRATNLAYKSASTYFVVAPGAYQIRAVPAGTAPASRAAAVTISLASNATPAPLAFSGGAGRTVVLADNSTGGAPLRAVVIADR
ncbi:MAG: DUF4397 domain-containing protein [Povalibacter sp.]